MNLLNALSNTLNTWVRHFIFGLGLTMTVIVVAQVFARYVINHSLFWSEELARYCLVWISFLGASVAYHDRVHPGINLFGSRLSMTMERILMTLVHLVSIGLFFIMIVHGLGFAFFVRLQITPALAIPKWIIMGILPLSGVIFMVHGVRFLIQDISRNNRPEQQDQEEKE